MKPARFDLFTSERRILSKIVEVREIGIPELDRQLAGDPAHDAMHAILRNLSLANFATFVEPYSITATPEGRQYIEECHV